MFAVWVSNADRRRPAARLAQAAAVAGPASALHHLAVRLGQAVVVADPAFDRRRPAGVVQASVRYLGSDLA